MIWQSYTKNGSNAVFRNVFIMADRFKSENPNLQHVSVDSWHDGQNMQMSKRDRWKTIHINLLQSIPIV